MPIKNIAYNALYIDLLEQFIAKFVIIAFNVMIIIAHGLVFVSGNLTIGIFVLT